MLCRRNVVFSKLFASGLPGQFFCVGCREQKITWDTRVSRLGEIGQRASAFSSAKCEFAFVSRSIASLAFTRVSSRWCTATV